MDLSTTFRKFCKKIFADEKFTPASGRGDETGLLTLFFAEVFQNTKDHMGDGGDADNT